LVHAAVKAKLTDAAVPNIAARHQRGPRMARKTVKTMIPTHTPPVTAHFHPGGGVMPYSGSAKYKKPDRPAATAIAPIHSRPPILNLNQIARIAARNTSSVVRIGWTCESLPTCRATAWSRKETIISAKPSSQTPRRRACLSRLSLSADSAGAVCTASRWRTLVRALTSEAASAST
jgi:hypothetical protein